MAVTVLSGRIAVRGLAGPRLRSLARLVLFEFKHQSVGLHLHDSDAFGVPLGETETGVLLYHFDCCKLTGRYPDMLSGNRASGLKWCPAEAAEDNRGGPRIKDAHVVPRISVRGREPQEEPGRSDGLFANGVRTHTRAADRNGVRQQR